MTGIADVVGRVRHRMESDAYVEPKPAARVQVGLIADLWLRVLEAIFRRSSFVVRRMEV